VIVIADGDEFGKIGTRSKRDRLIRSERAVMTYERSGSKLDTTVSIDGDRRTVVDDAAVAYHQACAWIQEQPAVPADPYPSTNLDPRMDHAPALRSYDALDSVQASVKSVQAHEETTPLRR
jgi:hypothetical protein